MQSQLMAPQWQAAVQALLRSEPPIVLQGPKPEDRERAVFALVHSPVVLAEVAARRPSSSTAVPISPQWLALVIASGNPAPSPAALQWLQAILDGTTVAAPLLLYWAGVAAAAVKQFPNVLPPDGPGAVPQPHQVLYPATPATPPTPAMGGAAAHAKPGNSGNTAPDVINTAAVDEMRPVIAALLFPDTAFKELTSADMDSVTHTALVMCVLQAVAEVCAALQPPCDCSAHIQPFATKELLATSCGSAGFFPTIAACALAEAAAKSKSDGNAAAAAVHCTAVSLQVGVLRPMWACLEPRLRDLQDKVPHVAAFLEHLTAACSRPQHSVIQQQAAAAHAHALPEPVEEAVNGAVPAATVVHDLFLGPWAGMLPLAQTILEQAVAGSEKSSVHDTIMDALRGGPAPLFDTQDPLSDACRKAVHALMDLRAWGEYETLVHSDWGGCPATTRTWSAVGIGA
jgi:hypothetical protein